MLNRVCSHLPCFAECRLGQTLMASDFCPSLAFKSFSTWYYESPTIHALWSTPYSFLTLILWIRIPSTGNCNRKMMANMEYFLLSWGAVSVLLQREESHDHYTVWQVQSDVFCRVHVILVLLPLRNNIRAMKNTLIGHLQPGLVALGLLLTASPVTCMTASFCSYLYCHFSCSSSTNLL